MSPKQSLWLLARGRNYSPFKWLHNENSYRRRPNKPKQSKQIFRGLSLMKISRGRPTFMKSLKKYPLVSVLLSWSGHLFQYILQVKYRKVLSSHTLIIAALYEMAWPNSLVRNFKNFKIVLSELSPNLAMILVPDFFLTRLVGTIYRLEGLNKRLI